MRSASTSVQYRIGPQNSPIDVQNFRWGVLGLAVYHAVLVAEALRSGINTVPKVRPRPLGPSAWTSARACPTWCCPRRSTGAIAPLGNVMIALTKNTVVATIGVAEASYLMKGMIEFRPDLIYVIFGIMAAGFVILTLPLGDSFHHLFDDWQ